MSKILCQDTFKPTPEQRQAIREAAARRGIDPAVRDDSGLYEALDRLRRVWEAAHASTTPATEESQATEAPAPAPPVPVGGA